MKFTNFNLSQYTGAWLDTLNSTQNILVTQLGAIMFSIYYIQPQKTTHHQTIINSQQSKVKKKNNPSLFPIFQTFQIYNGLCSSCDKICKRKKLRFTNINHTGKLIPLEQQYTYN